jgi:hypothetical protein
LKPDRLPDGVLGRLARNRLRPLGAGSCGRYIFVRSLELNPSVPLTTGTFNLLSKTESRSRLSGRVQSRGVTRLRRATPVLETLQPYRDLSRAVNPATVQWCCTFGAASGRPRGGSSDALIQ